MLQFHVAEPDVVGLVRQSNDDRDRSVHHRHRLSQDRFTQPSAAVLVLRALSFAF